MLALGEGLDEQRPFIAGLHASALHMVVLRHYLTFAHAPLPCITAQTVATAPPVCNRIFLTLGCLSVDNDASRPPAPRLRICLREPGNAAMCQKARLPTLALADLSLGSCTTERVAVWVCHTSRAMARLKCDAGSDAESMPYNGT
jgi:hypothetical protein